MTIIENIGKKNIVANFLSRLIVYVDEGLVDDHFPHENIFFISIYTHWFSKIANLLTFGMIPPHLS